MTQEHTLGPWCWQSFDGGKTVFLGTPDRGRLVVMDFIRTGMQSAMPRFARRTASDRGGILLRLTLEEIDQHPDARLIKAAPDLLKAAKSPSALHDELAEEIDKKTIDAAFDRWSAAMDALVAAIANAESVSPASPALAGRGER